MTDKFSHQTQAGAPIWISFVAALAASALAQVFIVVIFRNVFANGLCCADDAFMAVVAKNLAWGYGYSTSTHWTGAPGLFPFSYEISTGPVLLIPAAALIHIFGNLTWVPGLTTAFFALVLISAIFTFQLRRTSGLAASLFLISFLVLCAAYTSVHLEHWFSLLGEVPAALFVIIAGFIFATHPDKSRSIAIAAFLLGLAAQTKLLAILGAVPLFLWLVGRLLIIRSSARVGALAVAIACILVPTGLFEGWKLFSLGLSGFLHSMVALANFVGSQGIGPISIAEKFRIFEDRFGVELWVIAATQAVALWVVWLNGDQKTKQIQYYFVAASVCHLVWWILIAPGWARYALIGLFYHAVVISCMATCIRTYTAPVMAVLLIVQVGHPTELAQSIRQAFVNGFSATERVRALEDTARFLALQQDNIVFVSGWWATAVDLEYLLPRVGSFYRSEFAPKDTRPALLVRNTLFTARPQWNPGMNFSEWEQRCKDIVYNRPPYLITKCPEAN